MLSFRHRLRLAQRIEKSLGTRPVVARADLTVLRQDVLESARFIQTLVQRLEYAASRGWRCANKEVADLLASRLWALSTLTNRYGDEVAERSDKPVIERDLLAEFEQLEAEFGSIHVDWKHECLSVTTDPIELDDVALGAFGIELFWSRLNRPGSDCFDVVAITPRPAACTSEVTHPHVRDRTLCAGDATRPIAIALEAGRLTDAFQLVNAVLQNYNRDSAFARLDEWDGQSCADCGRSIIDETNGCEVCGSELCDSCITSCNVCENPRCLGCLADCAVCEQGCCRRCRSISKQSSRLCCSNCFVQCEDCEFELPSDECAEGTQLCPDCAETRKATIPTNDLEDAHASSQSAETAPESPDVVSPGVAQADVVLPRS